MNTENDQPLKRDIFDSSGERDAKDDTLASLEAKIAALEDKMLEERFLWVIVVIFLADAFVFTQMANWAGALVIGIFQLIAVVVLADRCRVNTVLPLIDKLTGFASRFTGSEKDSS